MDFASLAVQKRQVNVMRQASIDAGKSQHPAIDSRLRVWGEWTVANRCEGGGGGSVLAALIDGGGVVVRSTGKAVNMAEDVYDTERAVCRLDDKYREVVFLKYLEPELSDQQRADRMKVSRRTFLRYVATAQQNILFYLKPPARKASVRDQMRQNQSAVKNGV